MDDDFRSTSDRPLRRLLPLERACDRRREMTYATVIARKVHGSLSDEDDEAVLAELRSRPDAESILQELSRSSDLEVRGWVPGAAREVLGERSVPLVMRMTNDRDADIRDLALQALEAIDPELLDPLIKRLRRNLASKDDNRVFSTAWRLAERGDLASIGPIQAWQDRYEPWMWQHKVASVILLVLKSPDEVAVRIRDHDHDRMTWLSYAAIVVNTSDSRDALTECSVSAPDEDCRRMCAYTLTKYGGEPTAAPDTP
jgi:hypothetical protein